MGCFGAVSKTQLGFEIPVEVFGRIALRGIGRQVKEFDPFGAFADPPGDGLGVMGFQVVQNQKDFLGTVRDQLAQELDEQLGVHRLLDEAEPHQPLVADGRDHGQSRPATGGGQHRGFARRGVAP